MILFNHFIQPVYNRNLLKYGPVQSLLVSNSLIPSKFSPVLEGETNIAVENVILKYRGG